VLAADVGMEFVTGQLDPQDGETIAHLNLHEPRSMKELYRLYGEMRAKCPVAHSDQFGGHYIVTDYEEIRRIGKDPETFSSARGVFMPQLGGELLPPVDVDPPDHTFWRGIAMEELSVSGVRNYEAGILRDVTALIDGFVERGACDLVEDFAAKLPVMTICDVIGVDPQDSDEVVALTAGLEEGMSDPENRLPQVVADAKTFISRLLEERRREPREDMLTRLANDDFDGRRLRSDDLWGFLLGLLAAGNETTISAMSSLLLHIASEPTVRDRLIGDPRLIKAAIEETVRLDSPLHVFSRTPTRDVTIKGVGIPAGCPVVVNYAGANRDPAVFEDPDRLDLDRGSNPHLGFGFGLHRCVGAPLARADIRIAVEQVLRRIPDVAISVEVDSIAPTLLGGQVASIHSLPVRFTPGRPSRSV
jgi:cytochrome P450